MNQFYRSAMGFALLFLACFVGVSWGLTVLQMCAIVGIFTVIRVLDIFTAKEVYTNAKENS